MIDLREMVSLAITRLLGDRPGLYGSTSVSGIACRPHAMQIQL
jgi:hypothetical protein